MKAVIKLDIPDYQIGQEVSVYFKDTMCIKGVCQEDSTIDELEKIKDEIGNEFVDLQDGSEEWRSYVNDAVLSCYEIVDKHIIDLKEKSFGETTNSKGVLEQIAEEQKTLLDTTKAWSKSLEHGDIY